MMTNVNVLQSEKVPVLNAPKILTFAATSWLAVTTIGQWIFGVYILSFYGKSTLAGEFEKWNQVLPHGYVEGDWKGNLVVGMHVLLAAVLVIGGPLQLITQIRSRFPRFHRWLGRTYVTTAIFVSIGGLIMIWTREGVDVDSRRVSISTHAIYIIGFALLAIRYARARQFEKHRNWALRLFMVVSGVWFFRVLLMFWLLINGGPVGFDPKTFTGPFLTGLSVFTYAIPISLIILEMYFYAKKNQGKMFSLVTSAIIFIATIIMGIGIFAATMGMWLPRIE
ncbi:DUF2306 domain-containing protein [Dyadobacter pollutisoli]|uniref:DUF2306 domain-containing protein n=1 Tax=Dyadobacter pollutisoli TaxID=2910158 RepID=A0A9E8SN10_9BACT|nr:DUF2306 domain-containing protein [Dyadobacter pollutisoli]WAC15360.1 DUF2306 domain-containing protein [Dyadobacter pollutisoli]